MILYNILNTTILKDRPRYQLRKDICKTEFGGCQCFKDCDCNQDFKSETITIYKVIKRKINDPEYIKTKWFGNKDEAIEYCKLLIKTQYQYLKS